jgi:hypothetical protein
MTAVLIGLGMIIVAIVALPVVLWVTIWLLVKRATRRYHNTFLKKKD